ncbi:MAG: chitobiase/beta-hexosaminidase C-terminal domain-containing protein [Bacteroidales bacterium]|nr:chitobiase/beta-hexosaminidase C-terminal domain-containing protein [Bacteroidales bacterium]
MKKFLLLSFCFLLACFSCATLLAQVTIYSENMGTPSGTINVNIFTGWSNSTVTYLGGGACDVRITSPSSGYTTASGAGNVMINNATKWFKIGGINTLGYTNLKLQFGLKKSAVADNGSNFKIEVSTDDITYTSLFLDNVLPTGSGTAIWHYVTISSGIPSSATIYLKFSDLTNEEYRLDDLLLTGVSGAPPVVATPVITPATGLFSNSPVTVSISCATSDATIRYTMDGSEPTTSSAIYSAPFDICESTTIKAIAWKSGFTESATDTSVLTLPVATTYTVTLHAGTGTVGVPSVAQTYCDEALVLPAATPPVSCAPSDPWAFYGWSTVPLSTETATAPTIVSSTSYVPTTDHTLYAIYAKSTLSGNVYAKINDVSELGIGARYLIAAHNLSNEWRAIRDTLTGNNQKGVLVTVSGNQITLPATLNPTPFTLEGSIGNYQFRVGTYYLTATSEDNNRLKITTTPDIYSNFTINVNSGIISIVCTGKATRNVIKYNYADATNLLFSCYNNSYNTNVTDELYLFKEHEEFIYYSEPCQACATLPDVGAVTVGTKTAHSVEISSPIGSVVAGAHCTITDYGFEYDTVADFSTATTISLFGSAFEITIYGLDCGGTYYVRTFATNGFGTTNSADSTITLETVPLSTVSFDAGSGTVATPSVSQTYCEETLVLPAATALAVTCPPATWTFYGWATAPLTTATTGAPTIVSSSSYLPASNHTLYAIYTEGTQYYTYPNPALAPTDLVVSIIDGDSYTFFGVPLTLPGIYTHLLTTALGCDSLIRLNLIVTPSVGVPCGTAIDAEGNYYYGILINGVCWLNSNLKTQQDSLGNSITSYVYVSDEYSNEANNEIEFGRLYDFRNAQQVCPQGWRLPTVAEATSLIAGGTDDLKATDLSYWKNDPAVTNASGLTVRPAGYYDPSVGGGYLLQLFGYFWTSESSASETAKACNFITGCPESYIIDYKKANGISVRCVKK